MRRYFTLFLLCIACLQLHAQGSLRFYSEGRLFFSGDPVQTFIIPGDEQSIPVSSDERVDVVLVSSQGLVKMHETYLITELEKSAVMVLAEELPTDNYRLIASWNGLQSIIPIYVFEPSVLSSVVQDERLDTSLGLEELVFPASAQSFPPETTGNMTVPVETASGKTITISKIANQSSLNVPGVGIQQTGNVDLPDLNVSVEPRSDHPDSRISIYFVDQGIVEEHYLNELQWLNLRMGRHYGTSRICAYQFDQRGDNLGRIPINVQSGKMPVFPKVDGKVPYNKDIQVYLNDRKNRKFINQVYGQVDMAITHFAPEEWPDPEISVNAGNYVNLASLEEIINNVVPKSQVIRKNKQSEIRLSPNNSGYRYSEGPLVLLNGMPVSNIDSLLEIPSAEVSTVEIYNSLESIRRFGTLGRFGVMSVTLLEEHIENYEVEPLPVYRGINDMETEQGRLKSELDIRDVVSWELNMSSSAKELSWTNAHVEGEYVIFIYQIYPDGRDSSDTISFEVKPELR